MTDRYKDYHLRNENVKEMIEGKYADALGHCRDTLEIFLEILDLASQQIKNLSISQTVIDALMIQSYNDFWCGILLCSHGFQFSAFSQLRNMINRVIDAKYITVGESESLAIRWVEFAQYQVDKQIKTMGKTGKNFEWLTSEKRSAIESGAKKYREKYGNKGQKNNDWSGMGILEKAKAVELTELYEGHYKILSNYAHSNVLASTPYYRGDGVFSIGPQDVLIEETLKPMGIVFLKQLHTWVLHLGLDIKEQNEKLRTLWVKE